MQCIPALLATQFLCVSVCASPDTSETCMLQLSHGSEKSLGGTQHSVVALPCEGSARRGLDYSGETVDDHASNMLKDALPLAWVHIPKCGSSIANSLIHLPGVCPGIPDTEVVNQERWGEGPLFIDRFVEHYKGLDKACPGLNSFDADFRHTPHRFHTQFNKVFEGRSFIMMRQPEQRIISEFNHRHLYWDQYTCRFTDDLRKYAQVMSGVVARTLTRDEFANYPMPYVGAMKCSDKQQCPPCGDFEPPTATEMQLAKKRLRTGFAFVGILEQWDLSICLLHAMFGGCCHEVEFADNRPGPNHTDQGYDTAGLRGYVDTYDGVLYEEALKTFQENMRKYNVSAKTCSSCFRAAGRL